MRAVILIGLLPLFLCASSSPQKLWEVRLSGKLTEPAGWNAPKGHPVTELAFSPDGSKIAVTVDDHYQGGVWKIHLLIVDVQNPQEPFRQFDLETCGHDLTWSPDGRALLICGRILRLDDGSSCILFPVRNLAETGVLVSRSFWFTADRVILFDRLIVDRSCREVGKWAIAGDWYVEDTTPEKGRMLLRESVTRTAAGRTFSFPDYAIADRDSRRVTSGLLVQAATWSSNTMMAPGAEAVCSSLVPEDRSVLHCWKLADAEVIPLPSDLMDYRVTQAARFSPRLIAELWASHWWSLFDETGHMARRIVFELPSGRKIATLNLDRQHESSLPFIDDRYFKCTLSPAGDLLAEGGDGLLRLYRVP